MTSAVEDDSIRRTAVEEWSAYGLDCAISRTIVGFAGYVQTSAEVRMQLERRFGPLAQLSAEGVSLSDIVQPITYGPDDHGWIGFVFGMGATPHTLRPSVNALASVLSALLD